MRTSLRFNLKIGRHLVIQTGTGAPVFPYAAQHLLNVAIWAFIKRSKNAEKDI